MEGYAVRVNAETKEATRRRILMAAKKQFAKTGFEATTTRDIESAAEIAVGTLFNYFPAKESIVECMVADACDRVAREFRSETAPQTEGDDNLSLEEQLFAHAAAVLRKLKPYRKYLPAILETTLSPLATRATHPNQPSL